MSPVSRSKSKDKKAGKEPPKVTPKPSSANAAGGIPTSGYNPLLGTFHTLDSVPVTSNAALHANGRFRNIDETDSTEYDSVSNNGSWSGESEDHKEKISNPPLRPEAGHGGDNDKREKIRQKNEKKHQRQKERRAQELHEKCTGYLMSRKLEALAQQLVAMGFSSERATMALIQNEGKLEESVSWLFEGAEEAHEHKEHTLDSGGNLKIDISEELARIAGMENKYKCSKQEVERAVVACEGNLDKAEEALRSQKQDSPRATVKPSSASAIPSKRDERDFKDIKVTPSAGSFVDPVSRNMESSKKVHPRLEGVKPLQVAPAVDKKWPNTGSNPLASSLQVSSLPVKTEARYVAVGNELKNLQLGTVKKPVIVVQRPQSINPQQTPTSTMSSSPPGSAAGWYPSNTIKTVKPNGVMPPHIPSTRSASTNQLYSQFHYEQHQQPQQFASSNGSLETPGTSQGNTLWGRTVASQTHAPAVAAASSLGLFSGLGTNGIPGSSPHIDWNSGGGSMLQLDYTNIDWSLDCGSLASRTGSMWPMNSFLQNSGRTYDSFTPGLGVKATTRPVLSNRNGVHGFEDGVGSKVETYSGSREWTSPFEERDLFALPRQFVSAPSL